MDALELKLSLIEQLKTIDDVKLLTQIKNLIKEVLKKSREESKKGLGMTTEELRKRYPLCE